MGWSAGRHVDRPCGRQMSPWPARKVTDFGQKLKVVLPGVVFANGVRVPIGVPSGWVWGRVQGVVGGGFPVENQGKREGGGGGGVWGGGDMLRSRQVNAQALSKLPFSNLPFSFQRPWVYPYPRVSDFAGRKSDQGPSKTQTKNQTTADSVFIGERRNSDHGLSSSEGKNSDHGLNFGLPRGGGRSRLDEVFARKFDVACLREMAATTLPAARYLSEGSFSVIGRRYR